MVASHQQPPPDRRDVSRRITALAERTAAALGRATTANEALTRCAELAHRLALAGDTRAARLILAAINGDPITDAELTSDEH
jgi:hypothetical protein